MNNQGLHLLLAEKESLENKLHEIEVQISKAKLENISLQVRDIVGDKHFIEYEDAYDKYLGYFSHYTVDHKLETVSFVGISICLNEWETLSQLNIDLNDINKIIPLSEEEAEKVLLQYFKKQA